MPTYSQSCVSCGIANSHLATVCNNCGHPLQIHTAEASPTMPDGQLAPDFLLKGRYRILGVLGDGGMGTVYNAIDTQLHDRIVAIKEMAQQHLRQQERIKVADAFKREAELLGRLHHMHLPDVYEYFFEVEHWYLVMSFIEGETLEEYLYTTTKRPLSIEEVLRIGLQLCSVLEYLHKQRPPIIFRDLKPANIMRTPHGHLYLIDFGIARHFKLGQAKDTVAFGSTGYAAPEQYGKTQTSPRSDIYSLGATLHQLLTGDDPSDSPFHFSSLSQQHLFVSAQLEDLLKCMVEMEPAKRPANMAEVKRRLQEIAAGKSGAGIQQQVQPAHSQVVDRILMPLRPPAPPGTVLLVFSQHMDQVTSVAWSPDGKYIASGSRDRTVRVWHAATGNMLLTYSQHSGGITCLQWSSTGTYIASGSSDRTVHVWDAATGDMLVKYCGHNGLWDGGNAVKALAWSPDSMRIASVSGDHTVQVWDALNGQLVLIYQEHGDAFPINQVAWSPDGKYIASVANSCRIWYAATGSTRSVNRGYHPAELAWSPSSMFIASIFPGLLTKQTVKIWEVSTGLTRLSYRGHSEHVHALAWSPDGRFIASADKDVAIWDATTGKTIYIHRSHASAVTSLAWSPDNTRIASSSVDATVQVWVARM